MDMPHQDQKKTCTLNSSQDFSGYIDELAEISSLLSYPNFLSTDRFQGKSPNAYGETMQWQLCYYYL